ncbi:hypothetical protein W02_34090 [Nitrospira sp. KM1]|uniref:putative Ig domain-containing protein n=1 Tax=Nitrospira sp. KM1 TaxID=1936990 RepID=UPI0013A74769|nr:putative Ig domain-containing protein [Nitrospira sp. KM1]BCA56269.1 hypothetical protein W02_34090 [Nitrospira sp. KM1]
MNITAHHRLFLLFITCTFGVGCSSGGGDGNGGSGGGSSLAVGTTAANFGVIGNTYTSTLTAVNGTAPFTWSITGGSLPAGLSLNPSTGVMTGMPAAAGNTTVTIRVVDSAGNSATGPLLVAVYTRTGRVSVDGNGAPGNGISSSPSLNADGSLVGFSSQSTNLVPGVNGAQVYVHNRQTGQMELISRDNGAAVVVQGNGASSAPVISANGQFVVFVSQATNLLGPGTPSISSGQQIYVRDRQNGVTTLVSVDNAAVPNPGNGLSSAPAISSDGRFVAFVSQATNLLSPGTSTIPSGQQVYVRDRQNGLTTLVSVENATISNPGNGVSSAPVISADGQFVAFASLASNLLPAGIPVGVNQQIYLRDRQGNQTSLVSVDNNSPPNAGNGVSHAPSINGDGTIIAFDSLATNLLAPGNPSITGQQVYIRNRSLNQTNLVSADNNVVALSGNGTSQSASVSSDGRYVAFASVSTNLLAPAVSSTSGQQVFVRDRQFSLTTMGSQDNSSTTSAGNAPSNSPAMNGNGGFVAFASQASNLVTVPPISQADLYVRAIP